MWPRAMRERKYNSLIFVHALHARLHIYTKLNQLIGQYSMWNINSQQFILRHENMSVLIK